MKKSHAGMLLGVLLLIAAPAGLWAYYRYFWTPLGPSDRELADLLSSLVFGAGHVLIAACTKNRRLRWWAGGCAWLSLVYYSSLISGACLAVLLLSLLPILSLVVVLQVAKEICHGLEFPPGTCTYCGYDLQGLPEPRCPECGQAFDPASLAARRQLEHHQFPIHAGCALLANLIPALWGLGWCLPADVGVSVIIEHAGPGICMLGVAVINITAVRNPEYSRNSRFRKGLIASWVLSIGFGTFALVSGPTSWADRLLLFFVFFVFFVPPVLSASLSVRRRRRALVAEVPG